jgi:hypothetical protein
MAGQEEKHPRAAPDQEEEHHTSEFIETALAISIPARYPPWT